MRNGSVLKLGPESLSFVSPGLFLSCLIFESSPGIRMESDIWAILMRYFCMPTHALQSRDMQVTAIRFHTVPSHRSEGPQMICKLCDGGTLQGLTFTSQALPENLTRDPERIKERRIDINFPKLSRIIAGPVYA